MQLRGSESKALHYVLLDDKFVVDILPLLGSTQTRIVMEILRGYREGEPWARFTAAELHKGVLGIESSNFYRALGPLRAANIVYRPSRTTWQINPRVGWRGSRREWQLALRGAEPLGDIVQEKRGAKA